MPEGSVTFKGVWLRPCCPIVTQQPTDAVSPVNKQINDKERVAAAMENPNLREIVEQCVTEPDD